MKKLSLQLDDLAVESFATAEKRQPARGTVQGAATANTHCGNTCGVSCFTSCAFEQEEGGDVVVLDVLCTCPVGTA